MEGCLKSCSQIWHNYKCCLWHVSTRSVTTCAQQRQSWCAAVTSVFKNTLYTMLFWVSRLPVTWMKPQEQRGGFDIWQIEKELLTWKKKSGNFFAFTSSEPSWNKLYQNTFVSVRIKHGGFFQSRIRATYWLSLGLELHALDHISNHTKNPSIIC